MRPETYTGTSGRLLFVDALGRCLRAFDRPALRRAVNTHEQMMRFAVWLRASGYVDPDSNLILHADVVAAYEVWTDEAGIEPVDALTLLNRFEGLPGVERVRTRKLTRTWAIRLKGKAKAMAYRVAPAEELAERARTGRQARGRPRAPAQAEALAA